jgi:hypothetical protein
MHFLQWHQYFLMNQNHFDHINFQEPDMFCVEEQQLFIKSLQQFQRGEHSEGKHLLQFAKQTNDDSYIKAVKLFIKEEQHHALALGKFLSKNDISCIKHHWVDTVFRKLRQLSGIENTISILLVAETISKIYYRALVQATSSLLLQQICMQILRDEEKHLHFQCYTLRYMLSKKSRLYNRLWGWYLGIVLSGTLLVVWKYHQTVLKQSGMQFDEFFRSGKSIFYSLHAMIKGQEEIPPALSLLNDELLIA